MNLTNNNFLGASLAVRGNEIFACAPRNGSERYEKGMNLGQCFKRSGSDPKLKQIYLMEGRAMRSEMSDRRIQWKLLRFMGHAFNVTEEGDLIFGTPVATPSKNYSTDV